MRIVQITVDAREPFRDYGNPKPFFGTAPSALFEGFADLEDVELHVISHAKRPMQSPERLARNVWFYSLRVPRFGWLPTLYSGCVLTTRRALRTIRPDVVHGQGTERQCALCASLSGIPNVVTIHGNMRKIAAAMHAPLASFHGITAKLESFSIRRTDGVFCNSEYTEAQVASLAKQIWRVPNAVQSAYFESPLQCRPRDITLLNAGTITEHKQQIAFLGLVKRLFRRGLKFALRFAGGLNPETAYGRQFLLALHEVRELGDVEYVGEIAQADLMRLMDTSSALVHVPSEESFGLVVAESLSRNLPVFAFAVGGIPETAGNAPAVKLVPPNAWQELEEALAGWLHAGAPPLAELPRSAMFQRFHPKQVALRHVEIYRSLPSLTSRRRTRE